MSDSLVSLIQSDEIFAATLLCLAVDRFGTEMFSEEGGTWTPETFRMEFRAVLGGDLPDDNCGKLLAAISVLTSDALYRSLSSFLFTVHGLLGDGTDWSYAEPIDAEDLAWAVMEALLISPPAVLAFTREEAVRAELEELAGRDKWQ